MKYIKFNRSMKVAWDKPVPAGVSGKLTGRMPETVVARPYSGLHLRMFSRMPLPVGWPSGHPGVLKDGLQAASCRLSHVFLAASLMVLGGCAEWNSDPARMQAHYGDSVRSMVSNQMYNPTKAEFPAVLAPDGMEGNKADTLLNGGGAYEGPGYRTDIGNPGDIRHSVYGAPGLSNQGGAGTSTR